MKATIKKESGFDVLVVEVPIQKRPSKTGKTTVVASTNGNIPTMLQIDGKVVTLGLNAYIK